MTKGRTLVIVCFTTADLPASYEIVQQFEEQTAKRHDDVIIVDNAGRMRLHGGMPDRIRLLSGTNRLWEFSGWIEGLAACAPVLAGTITLMNDSYLRNWTITAVSRPLVDRMYADADSGHVAVWLDNFSHFSRPRFSRRPNSRLVVVPSNLASDVARSIEVAAKRAASLVADSKPLFDPASKHQLRRFFAAQQGRWDPKTLETRLMRVFIEHHMMDALPRSALAFTPRTYPGSIVYGILRKLVGEQR